MQSSPYNFPLKGQGREYDERREARRRGETAGSNGPLKTRTAPNKISQFKASESPKFPLSGIRLIVCIWLPNLPVVSCSYYLRWACEVESWEHSGFFKTICSITTKSKEGVGIGVYQPCTQGAVPRWVWQQMKNRPGIKGKLFLKTTDCFHLASHSTLRCPVLWNHRKAVHRRVKSTVGADCGKKKKMRFLKKDKDLSKL